MDRIEFGKRLISEAVSSNPLMDAAKKREKQGKNLQNYLKFKLAQRRDKLQDRQDEKKYNQSDSIVRKGIADKVRNSKFASMSKAKTSTISSTDKGATAMQKGAGNLLKTGIAAAKNTVKGVGNIAKGAAKTAVGARDFKKKLDDRKSQRVDSNMERKISKDESMMRKADIKIMKAKRDQKLIKDIEKKRKNEKTKNKFSPPSVTKKPEQNRKQISGGAERKALPAAKPRKFGTDPDGTPSKGALARSSKKIRRGMMQQREEFIHEVEEKDKKDKLDKVIDIMKGKNKIKINPDMKEEVKTDNWKDNYVATEYETVDLIKPEPLNPSNWRKELDSLRP